MSMSCFALIWMLASGGATLLAGTPFLKALQSEAPHIYSAIASPPINAYAWRRWFFPPFSGIVLSLSYWSELKDCPGSLGWANCLFVTLWSQILAAGVLAISLT
ncbi:hypothetical protein [Niveibacterium terrae]|uniref:hypothetical protein n=1 Tax=Niveibacterium terrae TaxID=3373598 RepID=UPI003A8CD4D5